jgi:hypothetical protein
MRSSNAPDLDTDFKYGLSDRTKRIERAVDRKPTIVPEIAAALASTLEMFEASGVSLTVTSVSRKMPIRHSPIVEPVNTGYEDSIFFLLRAKLTDCPLIPAIARFQILDPCLIRKNPEVTWLNTHLVPKMFFD